MNMRYGIAPLGILEILILFAVITAGIFVATALLKNPNIRKILLTTLTVLGIVFVILFLGVFFSRVSPVSPSGVNAVPRPFPMVVTLIKPLLFLCVLFLIVGMIRGIRNKKFGVGTVLIVAVLLVPVLSLFLSIGLPALHRARQIHSTRTTHISEADSSDADWDSLVFSQDAPRAGETTEPSIWHEGISEELTANVYPSKMDALRSLHTSIDREISRINEGKPESGTVLISNAGLQPEELIILMGEKQRSQADWKIVPTVMDLKTGEIGIGAAFIQTGDNTGPWAGISGRWEVMVGIPGKVTTLTALVDEKPWLTDFTAFAANQQGKRFATPLSHSSALTEEQAHEEAMEWARSAVDRVLWEMNPRWGNPFAGNRMVTPTDVENHGLILDRFSQQFNGMAGPIWRQAMLLDLSKDKIEPLARAKFAMIAQQQRNWANILLSFVGMTVVIAMVYAFLNAATRGYYSWSLRIAAVVLFGAGVMLVIMMA